MDKRSLIGVSICAVVLLVLGSLSNVVGYQSVKSTVMNESPLFQTRTQRATNQQQNSITSKYLGKGNTNNLFILQSNKTNSLREIVQYIQSMDESTFNRFVNYMINKIKNNDNSKDIDVITLINELHQIRQDTEDDKNFRNTADDERRTILFNYVPTACWFPGCYLLDFLMLIYILIVFSEMNKQTLLLSACFCPLSR